MDPKTLAFLMGAAGGASKVYVEDVFSTWLYTGNGGTQTITNGIDLSGKGGLVWIKDRTTNGQYNVLYDTNRGVEKELYSSQPWAQGIQAGSVTAFNNNGFSIGTYDDVNQNNDSFASWTFRKAAKFFDVVTYTGTGSARTVSHNLGSVPGCIIVKAVSTTGPWAVYHREIQSSLPAYYFLNLDTNSGAQSSTLYWNDTAPTASVFTVGNGSAVNSSGVTYVAYVFAHDAGGFGETGNDSIISCGSYTGNGSATGPTVTLGWEPQWLLIKRTDGVGDWNLIDNMRGFVSNGTDAELNPNLTNSESTGTFVSPLSTGFQLNTTDTGYNASGGGYMYIAIRRGPMKTPTDATKVFNVNTTTSSSGNNTVNVGFPPDHVWQKDRDLTNDFYNSSRLIGSRYLSTPDTTATVDGFFYWGDNTNFFGQGMSSSSRVSYFFRRAPGFFDVVCYKGNGTGVTQVVSHNLVVAPEFIIWKDRDNVNDWVVACDFTATTYKNLFLNLGNSSINRTYPAGPVTTKPTSTTVSVSSAFTNTNGTNYLMYLFSSCPGISKVGSYTGTGTTNQINCGFTNGARFVLIKRTDSFADWYLWDSARGIVAGNDPYLLLDGTGPETTGTDYIDTYSAGFEISSTAISAINANGGNFVFLAMA